MGSVLLPRHENRRAGMSAPHGIRQSAARSSNWNAGAPPTDAGRCVIKPLGAGECLVYTTGAPVGLSRSTDWTLHGPERRNPLTRSDRSVASSDEADCSPNRLRQRGGLG